MQWVLRDQLTDHERLDVLHLLNLCEAETGREAIDEGRRRTIMHGLKADHWLGFDESGKLATYAQVTPTLNPSGEECRGGLDEQLRALLIDQYGSLSWWIRGTKWPNPTVVERELLLMGLDQLPIASPIPSGYTLRTFHADDSAKWLAHNNASFAAHPEQGAWSMDDLALRLAEPWFDPSGFLLLERDGEIVASCWTKIHELAAHRRGEIYVISVDPSAQGHGLGRLMVTQGLATMKERGVHSAMLFVDATNSAANDLYSSLGFALERQDQLIRVQP
jgi:mycothiol synthase